MDQEKSLCTAQIGLNRNTSIDFVKCISIIGVLLIHVSAGGFSAYAIGGFDWNCTLFWRSMVACSVPVFFMCSGCLFLERQTLSLKRLYGKYILRILTALFFWAAAYGGVAVVISGTEPVAALKNLLLFRHHGHLYFLHMILLFYIFLPIVRCLVRNASKGELQYALVVWILLGILFPTARHFYPLTLLQGIPLQYAMNMTYSAIGYGLLGYYMNHYADCRTRHYSLLFLIGFSMTFGGTLAMSLTAGNFSSIFLEGMSPGVALMAIGFFGLGKTLPERLKENQIVKKITAASFCIYLVHDFFNIGLRSMGVTLTLFIPVFSIPVLTTLVVGGSFVIYLALYRIPIVNKYLI